METNILSDSHKVWFVNGFSLFFAGQKPDDEASEVTKQNAYDRAVRDLPGYVTTFSRKNHLGLWDAKTRQLTKDGEQLVRDAMPALKKYIFGSSACLYDLG